MTDLKEQIRRFDGMMASEVMDDPEDFLLDWLIDAIEAVRMLMKRDKLLTALEAAGVDNWEGYDLAIESIERKDEG